MDREPDKLTAWREFLRGLPPAHSIRRVILESWTRSRDAGVDPDPHALTLRRISDEDLQARVAAYAELIHAARPHLHTLSQFMLSRPHVVYLVDREGIVLDVVGNHPDMMERFGLLPGYDWSEGTMGTNGAGTALASKQPVAIVGAEHFSRPFHDCTCTAAPIWGPDDQIVGAIDVSTSVADATPERVLVVAYAARMIEQCLTKRLPESESTGLRQLFGPIVVLNVDDNEQGRYVKTRLLRQAGYVVKEASDGVEALEVAERERPQLMCLDVKLPRLDGMEVLRRLRADPRTASMMVLQVSATFQQPIHKVMGLGQGADGYLAAPYDPEEFLAMVKALLRMYTAREVLRHSEVRFRKVFEEGPLGMALVSPDYRFLKANTALSRMTGYSAEELRARSFVDLTHPDDIGMDVKHTEQLFRGDVPSYTLEKRYIKKNGAASWMRWTASIVHDSEGEVLYGLAMIEDISERKQQAERLEGQGVLLHMTHAMVRRFDGSILLWSRKCEELYGWSADEAIGAVSHTLLKTQFPKPLEEIEAELRQRGEWVGELVHTARDGREFIVSTHWVWHERASQEALVMEVSTDITRLKHMMRTVSENEACLSTIMQHSAAVIYLMDADSRFVMVNRQFESLFHVSSKELIGKSVYDVFPSTIAQAFEANNTQVLSRGVPCEFEEMVPHADGMRWYTSVKAPIADAAGRLAYVVGVSTDITERKQAEQEIQSLLQEAAQRERVLHEKQAQLLQAAKLASLGQIMTGVAHELNNPLNNIGLFVSNALDQIDSGMGGRGLKNPLSEQLRRALGEIHRAAQVIVHLRAFAGGHVAHGLVHDVNDIVRMAAAGVDARFRTDNITLILELTPMRLVLRGNEVLLKQTFMSVLMNAADAVTGGLMREVRIRSYQEAGHALILVEDTGVGIPAEILPHIFDPFFTTKEVGKGTGLGLSTSYGIIQDHHGDLRVTSRPGQGTVVTVTLPLAHEGVV